MVRDHAEFMCKSSRDPQNALVFCGISGVLHSPNVAECVYATATSRISPITTDKVAPPMINLAMKSSQHVTLGTGVILLDEPFLKSYLGKSTVIVAFEEKSAVVTKQTRLEQEYSGQSSQAFVEWIHSSLMSPSLCISPRRYPRTKGHLSM